MNTNAPGGNLLDALKYLRETLNNMELQSELRDMLKSGQIPEVYESQFFQPEYDDVYMLRGVRGILYFITRPGMAESIKSCLSKAADELAAKGTTTTER